MLFFCLLPFFCCPAVLGKKGNPKPSPAVRFCFFSVSSPTTNSGSVFFRRVQELFGALRSRALDSPRARQPAVPRTAPVKPAARARRSRTLDSSALSILHRSRSIKGECGACALVNAAARLTAQLRRSLKPAQSPHREQSSAPHAPSSTSKRPARSRRRPFGVP